MAEQDRAPAEGENIDTPPEGGDDPNVNEQQQAPPTVEELAARAGWKPQDQWKGDGWQPADEFLLKKAESRSDLNREIRSLRDEVGRISRTSAEMADQVKQRTIAERDSYWQQQLDRAVKDDKPELARQAADELAKVAVERQTAKAPTDGPSPEVNGFIERNRDWFGAPGADGRFIGGDPLARARVFALCNDLAQQGLAPAEQLQQAERAVRREFPELFKAPGKQPASVQTGGSRSAGTGGGSRPKGYADMPLEARQMADDFERRHGIKKEEYAAKYWLDVGKQERRVA